MYSSIPNAKSNDYKKLLPYSTTEKVDRTSFSSESQQQSDETTKLLEENTQKKNSTDDDKISTTIQRYIWNTFLASLYIGCIVFGLYIVGFYVRTILVGKEQEWDRTTPKMYHPERSDSNLAIGTHLVAAGYLMMFGTLQYFPTIRQRYMNLHRWNGRLSIVLGMVASLGGVYYIFAVGSTPVHIIGQQINWANTIFGICFLILCMGIYYHVAIHKNISKHILWAYRLAGLNLGNMYVRLCLTGLFAVWTGGDPTAVKMDASTIHIIGTFMTWTFILPFILLGDWLWRNEQQQQKQSSLWKVIFSFFLLIVFMTTLLLQAVLFWIPFVAVDLEGKTQGQFGAIISDANENT